MIRRPMTAFMVFCIALTGLAGNILANPELPVKFQRLMLEDGLSQSSIVSLYQDSRGFIWIGTQDGINRYDGRTFAHFKADPDIPNSLSDQNITCIAEDAGGDLWFGTEGGGFNRYLRDLDSFKPYIYDPSQPASEKHYSVLAILVDDDGIIWVGTASEGLVRFDPKTEQVESFVHDQANAASLPSNEILSLMLGEGDDLWVGSGAGLSKFSRSKFTAANLLHDSTDDSSLAEGEVNCLAPSQGGRMWVGTSTALCRLDPEVETFERYEFAVPEVLTFNQVAVAEVMEEAPHKVWVGSAHTGIFLLNPQSGEYRNFLTDPRDPVTVSDNESLSMLMDRTGVVWIGTSNGINRLDSKAKQFYHLNNQAGAQASLSDDCVWGIWETTMGDVWVVTENGLNIYDPIHGKVRVLVADPDNPKVPSYNSFVEVYQDPMGYIWLGARDGALNRYDPRTGDFQNIRAFPDSMGALTNDEVFQVDEGPGHTLWLGTMDGLEIFDLDTETFTAVRHDPSDPGSLPAGSIRAVTKDKAGRMWITGWGRGVSCLEPGETKFRHFRHDPNDPTSLSNNVVLGIFSDSRNRIWVGTSAGLNLLDPFTGKCKRYTERDGLPNNTIYAVQEDESGRMWLSTNYGLSRLDPETGVFRNYTAREGVQDNEFNMGAAHCGHSGLLYFGGINGFNFFRADSISHNPYVPEVAITDFRIFNKPVRPGDASRGRTIIEKTISEADRIELNYSDNVISFEFGVLHFASPENNQFAYIMDGFEDSWNEVGTRNHATYTNLPQGDYVFRVRGSNNDGLWNEEGTSVAIHVRPPFYRKAWFIVGAVLLLAGIIYGLHRYRMRLLDVKNRALEARVRGRTEDLMRVNDSLQQEILERKRIEDELREAKNHAEAATQAKGDFLANMSHEIRTPMNGVLGLTSIMLDTELSAEQRDYSEMIYSSAKNLLVVINDILDFSKIEAGMLQLESISFDLCQVVDEVTEMLTLKAQEKGLQFSATIASDVPRVLQGDPGRLRQILINLTNNAVKFTGEGHVSIHVSLVRQEKSWSEIKVEVQDTGVGIPADRLDKIFGSFTQVDASVTRQFGGTGLGLAIVKQLVELMGGEVGVNSEEGEGSTFWFSAGFSAEKVVRPTRDVAPVLVVHRQESVRKVIRQQLDFLGYSGYAVESDFLTTNPVVMRMERFAAVLVDAGTNGQGQAFVQQTRHLLENRSDGFILLTEPGAGPETAELEAMGLNASLSVPLLHGRLETALGGLLGDAPDAQAQEARSEQRPTAADPAQAQVGDEKPLLLLAEDNPVNQRVASLILEKLGYAVQVANNGLEALEAVAETEFAAVLMDVQMPQMDGLEATRRIRASDSKALNPDVPIIALTAHAMDQARRRSLDAGMDDHVSKPIDAESIKKVLELHLSKPRTTRAVETPVPEETPIPMMRV